MIKNIFGAKGKKEGYSMLPREGFEGQKAKFVPSRGCRGSLSTVETEEDNSIIFKKIPKPSEISCICQFKLDLDNGENFFDAFDDHQEESNPLLSNEFNQNLKHNWSKNFLRKF
jgi:hypothetical protein